MLSDIRIHTFRNNLYFNLADIGKLLSRRPDSLVRSKYVSVKSFKINNFQPINFTNESSFRLLFKDNADILAELDQYKLTGKIAYSDKYSNLLTIAYFYICADGSDAALKLNGFIPLDKSLIAKNIDKPEVALALLQVFLNVFFNDLSLIESEQMLLGLLIKQFPVPFDTKFLSELFFGLKPPETFVKALCKAEIKTQSLAEFRHELKNQFTTAEINSIAKTAITRAYNDVNSVFGINTWAGTDKKPLQLHHFQYPRVLEAAELPNGSEVLWLGE